MPGVRQARFFMSVAKLGVLLSTEKWGAECGGDLLSSSNEIILSAHVLIT